MPKETNRTRDPFHSWLRGTASALDTAGADFYAMTYADLAREWEKRGPEMADTLTSEIKALLNSGEDEFATEMLHALLRAADNTD